MLYMNVVRKTLLGVPIEQVNYLAGHKSMAMTKRYDHANEEHYGAAIEALDAAKYHACWGGALGRISGGGAGEPAFPPPVPAIHPILYSSQLSQYDPASASRSMRNDAKESAEPGS